MRATCRFCLLRQRPTKRKGERKKEEEGKADRMTSGTEESSFSHEKKKKRGENDTLSASRMRCGPPSLDVRRVKKKRKKGREHQFMDLTSSGKGEKKKKDGGERRKRTPKLTGLRT